MLRFGKECAQRKIHLQAALHADEMLGALVMKLMSGAAELEAVGRLQWQIQLVPLAPMVGQHVSVYYQIGRLHLQSLENFN